MDEDKIKFTFPEKESSLLSCVPRLRIGVSHIPQVIGIFDNARESIGINLKKNDYVEIVH